MPQTDQVVGHLVTGGPLIPKNGGVVLSAPTVQDHDGQAGEGLGHVDLLGAHQGDDHAVGLPVDHHLGGLRHLLGV